MNFLKLTLSGVSQYYSSNDTIALRTTYSTSIVPTKSAIIGLLCSAFGYDRNSEEKDKLYNNIFIKYKIISSGTIFEDFQTIKPLKSQQNYMNKFYTRNVFSTVSGGQRNGQLIKNVQYLQDAKFEVYIGTDDKKLKQIFNVLKNPTYSLYLGKRCCIPNTPIVTTFDLIKEEDLKDVYDCA